MKRIVCAVFASVAAVSAWATDYTWSGTPANYTSPRAAAAWCDKSLWGGSGYPNGSADTVTINPATTYSTPFFITNNVAISLLRSVPYSTAPSLCYVSDQPMTLFASAVQTKMPWTYATTVIGGGNPYFANVRFCGDLSIPSGQTCLFHGSTICYLHYDRYATAAGAVREVPAWLGTAKTYELYLYIYAPESSATDVKNKFSQVAGSPYLQRASGQTGALSVGTLVTGPGVPAGTFLKRVFPKREWIELSNPVTTTAANNELTFAAFTPKVHHRMANFSLNGSDVLSYLYSGKYREADELVVDIGYLGICARGTTCNKDLFFDLASKDDGDAPAYPGQFVIHEVSATQNTNVKIGTCDLLFSNTTNGMMENGLPRSVVRQVAATSESKLSVTGAMTAAIGELQDFTGTIVKAGSGTLRVGFTTNQVANTGRLVVKEGTFAIANPGEGESKSADDIPTVGSLEVAAGATLRVPTRGLRVTGALTVAAGATLAGTGTVYVASASAFELKAGAIVESGVKFVDEKAQALQLEVPAVATEETIKASDPAFWIDLNKESTLELVTLDESQWVTVGTKYSEKSDFTQTFKQGVYRINDVRKQTDGDKYLFSTNCAGSAPTAHMPLRMWDKRKNLYHAYFKGNCLSGGNTTASITNTDAHAWSKPIANIRVVFEVYGGNGSDTAVDCSMPFLGATSVARLQSVQSSDTVMTDEKADIWGRNSKNSGFFSWATPAMKAGAFHVNGTPTEPADDSVLPPYGSPLVYGDGQTHRWYCHPLITDLTIPDTYDSNGKRYAHIADSYTFAPSYCGTTYKSSAAQEQKRLFELIVYTNMLTKAEIASIRRYLMRKWLSQDVSDTVRGNNSASRLAAANGPFEVAADTGLYAETVTDGGTFTKTGSGTCYIENAVAPSASVAVAAGTVVVRSFDPSSQLATNVNDQISIHLDAADVNDTNFTLQDDETRGVKVVTNWKDVKSDPNNKNNFSLWKTGTTNGPFIVENKLNGHAVVDFGAFYDLYYKDDVSKLSPALNTSCVTANHAFVAVWGSEHGGGTLLGETDSYWGNGIGLSRNQPTYGAAASDPIIRNEVHQSFGNPCSYLSRINGTSVNPRTTGLSGSFDIVSHVAWTEFSVHSLQDIDNNDRQWFGGGQIGELLVFKMGPSPEHLSEIEAYLRKKWFNEETPGFQTASLGSVSVASGAALEVTGGGSLTVKSLAVANGGSVKGDLALAADAELTVTVNDDGSVTPVSVDGSLDISKGGTVKLTGATRKLGKGPHVLVRDIGSATAANWTLDVSPLRKKYHNGATLFAEDGNLCLRLTTAGFIFTVQ